MTKKEAAIINIETYLKASGLADSPSWKLIKEELKKVDILEDYWENEDNWNDYHYGLEGLRDTVEKIFEKGDGEIKIGRVEGGSTDEYEDLIAYYTEKYDL